MHIRGAVPFCLVAALLAETPARAQSCVDLAEVILDFAKDGSPLGTIANLNDAKGVADAYLGAADGSKAEAVGKALATVGVTVVGGLGVKVLIRAGKIYVGGVEWTVDAAERMRAEAFLCGGVSVGYRLPVDSVFRTTRAQEISRGMTCKNFPDWLDTPAKFEAFRVHFKGSYSLSMNQFGNYQSELDQQWKAIEDGWKVREAERRLKQLQDALTRKLDEQAKNACPPKPPPLAELGSDTSDPAKLPEPELPPEGMLVLVETVVTPYSMDPSISHTAAPQRNTMSAYYADSSCVWSAPPKALVAGEVFGLDFSVSVNSKNRQRHSEGLVVKSGFVNVNSLPNEVSVSVEPGGSKSAQGHLELGTGDLAYAQDYMTWYLQVGGCGGNVDYLYKFRKP